MKVEILYFAQLREVFLKDNDQLELPEGALVSDVVDWVLAQPGAAPLRGIPFMNAVNEEFCRSDHKLMSDDRVALIPPMAGG